MQELISSSVSEAVRSLSVVWAAWKRAAHVIGTFQARFLLTVFYVLLVAPVALLVRAFADPLRLAQHSDTYWVPVERPPMRTADEARRPARGGVR